MWQSLPEFGTAVLYAILVVAAYTFAVAVAAGSGRPRLLAAARLGAYGASALVGLGVLVLAHAFVSHDFRIRYVAQYSDRSMPTTYLVTALWGGQDGSLLWWLFLTSVFSAACVRWLRGRYRALQPYVIATLMAVMMFFAVLMTFAANPFATSVAGAPADGRGLNTQLQNFYMIIHPPSLYLGFVSAAIPFAFAVAALVTGRLGNEWIVATRKWMLFSWLFLSIGNALGMLWAYEELGWGGYWAWDPVENAAFLPWLTATAFLHSTMIQERRGLLRVWNVFLIAATFFLTIFGTFLTRSGLISSVHSFAQSGIGIYFVHFMGLIVATTTALVVWRLPLLRSEGRIETPLSREAAFLLNNWGLLSLAVFIALATIYPRISEWLLDEKSTLGPTFYNAWIPPVALAIFALMGLAPLFGWRKTSPELFARSFRWPLGALVTTLLLHLTFGRRLGYPPIVEVDRIYPGALGAALAAVGRVLPLVTVALAAFNVAVVVQEFVRGVAARRRAGEEPVLLALVRLVARSRRRYGGYIVHLGIVLMFLGFAGSAWDVDREASLRPGESITVDRYTLTYAGPRTEVDTQKRMIFADVDVREGDRAVGRLSPAKFVYRSPPNTSTEIAKRVTFQDDLYLVVAMINPETKVASFLVHLNALVLWIWLGVMVLIVGAAIAMWPEPVSEEARGWGYVRAATGVAGSLVLALALAAAPSLAHAQQLGEGMNRSGTVQIQNDSERRLFHQLLCMCGDCPREPLSSCTCGFAHQTRDEIRADLAAGKSVEAIQAAYQERYGIAGLAVPPNEGTHRALWVLPMAAMAAGAGLVFFTLRRWSRGRRARDEGPTPAAAPGAARDEYDARLDAELRALDDDR